MIMLVNLRNDLNTGFYKDLDTNFIQALELSATDFEHEKLIEMLKNGNIPEKQIAAMKLNELRNKEDAEFLVSNLTGCDGKIREAVALKINNLLLQNRMFSKYFVQAEIFADASIDINANICRLIIDSVLILKEDNIFAEKYLAKILLFINEAFEELDKFIFRDKKYVINKQLFKLYWALEALKMFSCELDKEILYPILERASQEREYTIREKVAQMLKNKNDKDFALIIERLKNDENYYVRNAINN